MHYSWNFDNMFMHFMLPRNTTLHTFTFFGVFFSMNDEEGRICVCKSESLFHFHFFNILILFQNETARLIKFSQQFSVMFGY